MAFSDTHSSCVLEPTACGLALFACLEPKGSLNLYELEALTLLADATILFDEIVYLDCHQPTFRFADAPKTREERAQEILAKHLKWDFFNCNLSIRDYPHSPWYEKVRLTRLEKEYDVEVNGILRVSRRLPHPVIGDLSWNSIAYIDKVNSAAARLGATVVHGKNEAVAILEQYQRSKPALTAEFIDHYDLALRRRFLNSSLRRHRELLHFAPLFLASAISTASSGMPEGILLAIAQMRAEVTATYRSLCNELLVVDQRRAERVVSEIEKLLRGLGQSDEPIPRSRGPVARSAIAVFRPLAAGIKIVQGDVEKASDVLDTVGDFLAGAEDMHSNIVKDADLYRRLNFFNRLHVKRPTSDAFYKDLERVFGTMEFSHQELDQFLEGLSPSEVYQRRRNRQS